MKDYLFIPHLLNLIARPRFFNRAVAISVRAAAAVIVLVGLVPFFQASKIIFNLPASEFNTITLLSVLLQLIGEAYAAFVSLIAIGGGIFIWFTAKGIDKLLS